MATNSSINQAELDKFNKNHADWWDTNGEFAILHQITPMRLKYIQQQINRMPSAKKAIDIIDVGTGGGLVSVELAAEYNVMAIDANQSNVETTLQQAKNKNLKLNSFCGTVEELLAQSKIKYDVVICLEVIEHVANPEFFVSKLTELAKDNGIIIISTINRNFKSALLAKFMAEYVLGFVKPGTHDYNKFIKPSMLKDIFAQHNWQLTDMAGLSYDILANDWHLSDNVDVNYFATFKQVS